MSGSFIDSEIDSIVEKFSDEPVIKVLKLLDWSRINKLSNKAKLINVGKHRIPYSPVLMTKIFLLQSMHGYSDVAMEKQLNFNLLFMKFCELSTTDRKPDHSTISKWRDRFIKDNIHDKLFSEINRQFEELGLIMKYGSVIDATIISSQARPRRKQLVINEDPEENVDLNQNHDYEDTEKEIETKEQQIVFEESKDPDARYLVKGKKIHYGYKMTTAVDPQNGLIQAVMTTAANIPDCKLLEGILKKVDLEKDSFVFADKGYASASNRDLLKDLSLKDRIMFKGSRNRPLITKAGK